MCQGAFPEMIKANQEENGGLVATKASPSSKSLLDSWNVASWGSEDLVTASLCPQICFQQVLLTLAAPRTLSDPRRPAVHRGPRAAGSHAGGVSALRIPAFAACTIATKVQFLGVHASCDGVLTHRLHGVALRSRPPRLV